MDSIQVVHRSIQAHTPCFDKETTSRHTALCELQAIIACVLDLTVPQSTKINADLSHWKRNVLYRLKQFDLLKRLETHAFHVDDHTQLEVNEQALTIVEEYRQEYENERRLQDKDIEQRNAFRSKETHQTLRRLIVFHVLLSFYLVQSNESRPAELMRTLWPKLRTKMYTFCHVFIMQFVHTNTLNTHRLPMLLSVTRARCAWSDTMASFGAIQTPNRSQPSKSFQAQFFSMLQLHRQALVDMEMYFRLNEPVHVDIDLSPGVSYFSDAAFDDVAAGLNLELVGEEEESVSVHELVRKLHADVVEPAGKPVSEMIQELLEQLQGVDFVPVIEETRANTVTVQPRDHTSRSDLILYVACLSVLYQ